MPSGNMTAMVSPTRRPNAAPAHHTNILFVNMQVFFHKFSHTASYLPMRKTGMKAPHGTGMVVATADIQN